MGSTDKFQEQMKQNNFRNAFNLAVSAFGQEERDNFMFILLLLYDFVTVQVSGSHCLADTRCGASHVLSEVHFSFCVPLVLR